MENDMNCYMDICNYRSLAPLRKSSLSSLLFCMVKDNYTRADISRPKTEFQVHCENFTIYYLSIVFFYWYFLETDESPENSLHLNVSHFLQR